MIQDIKTQIETILNELVSSGTLGEVIVSDFKRGVLEYDVSMYPVAILTTPAVASGTLTNRDNLRTLTFNIVVLEKGEDIATNTQVETLIETILDKFDNNPTLTGLADGGVEPSTSEPEATTTNDETFIAFMVTLKIKTSKALTF